MSTTSGKKKPRIFKGIDATLITILSITVVGTIGVSAVLIWIVATL